MTGEENLPHGLMAARDALLAALDVGLAQYRANQRWNHQAAVCSAIEQFVDAFVAYRGGRDELERRATLVAQLTGEDTAYRAARDAALAAFPRPCRAELRRAIHRGEKSATDWAIYELHVSNGVQPSLSEIDAQRQNIERVLGEQTLNDQARGALVRWRDACREIQREAGRQAVDGCCWLLRVYEAGDVSPPKHAVADRALLKTTGGGAHLAEIRAAVESLMAWARESRTAICPTCGKAAVVDENDRLRCPDCGNRAGTLSELLIRLQTGCWPPGAETETLAALRYLVRTRWGEWSVEAVNQLRDWLIAEKGLTREQSLVLTLPRVVELLREGASATSVAEGLMLTSEIRGDRRDDNTAKVVHSDDFRSVRWCGESYSFTVNQAPVIKVLYENWQRGTPDVGDETLLSAVDAEAPPDRLRDVFRKHPAWGTMIVSGGTKGTHRLAKPAEDAP